MKKYTQNDKIEQVTEKTLVVGVDIGSTKQYARAFDYRGRELDHVFCFMDCRSGYELFLDWMQGLPTAFPVADDIFLGSAAEWLGNILDETETEKQKYSDSKAERTACLILYRELNKHAQKAK